MKTAKKLFSSTNTKDNLIEEYKITISKLLEENKKLTSENNKLKRKLKSNGISYV